MCLQPLLLLPAVHSPSRLPPTRTIHTRMHCTCTAPTLFREVCLIDAVRVCACVVERIQQLIDFFQRAEFVIYSIIVIIVLSLSVVFIRKMEKLETESPLPDFYKR